MRSEAGPIALTREDAVVVAEHIGLTVQITSDDNGDGRGVPKPHLRKEVLVCDELRRHCFFMVDDERVIRSRVSIKLHVAE